MSAAQFSAASIERLQEWIGNSESRSDEIRSAPIAALSATLDREESRPRVGEVLPPLWHWLYFLPLVRQSAMDYDGHPKRGGFLPPVPLPRRMWVGNRVQFHGPLHVGETITRVSRIMFITGGVTSPTDPIWMPQFTDDEVRAAVEEAATRRKYVAAHCLTDEGAQRCVRHGIRSIEHGFGITDETARLIAASGSSYVVPTLAVLHSLAANDPELGLVPEMTEKVKGVLDTALASLENCARAGVKLGLGTDLFGEKFHPLQSRELEFRSAVQKPIDVLRSATSINAEIIQRKGELGVVAPGAWADLIALDGNPLNDMTLFAKPGAMPLVMKAGRMIRCRP